MYKYWQQSECTWSSQALGDIISPQPTAPIPVGVTARVRERESLKGGGGCVGERTWEEESFRKKETQVRACLSIRLHGK